MQLIDIICEFAIFHLPRDCALHCAPHCTEKTLRCCSPSSLHSKTTIPKDHYFTYKKEPKYHCARIGNNRCVIIYMTIGIFIFSVGLFTVLE